MASKLAEIAALFLKLGTIGFGGPAAHIAMMDREVVERRKWLSREEFLDLLGVTNLIPGPNSTEMAIQVGYRRAGFPGLMVAGLSFILPAALITGLFAMLYQQYGTLPAVQPFLRGIAPAVLAVILTAVWKLGQSAIKTRQLLVIALGVALAALFRFDQVLSLAVGTVAGAVLLGLTRPKSGGGPKTTAAAAAATGFGGKLPAIMAATGAAAASAAPGLSVPLWQLGLFFLKVGAILYGGGYVLVAYLEGGLVQHYHWLTEQQLVDAIAVGQFTPGPILSTATFVGYLIDGPAGAAVATAAIFLPSFFFVAAAAPFIPRLRRSATAALLLDAVNAASIGLMGAVTAVLAVQGLVDWRSWLIAVVAVLISWRWNPLPAWLVLGGAVAGWVLYY